MPETFPTDGNILKELPEQDRARLAAHIADMWQKDTEQIRQLIDEHHEAWDHYKRNKADPLPQGRKDGAASKPKHAGVRQGHIPRAADSLLAMQHNATFPQDDRFFRGTPQDDYSEDKQEQYETWLASNFAEGGYVEELMKHRLNCILDGTALLAVKWEQRKRRKVFYDPIYEVPSSPLAAFGQMLGLPVPTPEPVQVGVQRREVEDWVEWEGSAIEALDFTDWRADPLARKYEDAHLLRRWYMPVWQVKRDYDLDEVKPYHDYLSDDDFRRSREQSGIEVHDSIGKAEEEGKENALLMVCYDTFMVAGKVYENHVALVLNDSELLWFGPNPYDHGMKPYILTPYSVMPGQVYGQSAIKQALPLAAVSDKATNLILKLGNWAANPVFLRRLSTEVMRRMQDIQIVPGMTLDINQEGDIRQLEISLGNIAVLDGIRQAAEEKIMEIAKTPSVMTGEDPNKLGVTAFEIDQRVQAAGSHSQLNMTIFNNMCLEPLMQQAHENMRQYKTRDEFIQSYDEPLTPDDIKRLDFKWVITSTNAMVTRAKQLANKTALLQQLPNLLQLGIIKLKPNYGELDGAGLIKSIAQDSGTKDLDAYFEVVSQEQMLEEQMNAGIPAPGAPGGLAGQPVPPEVAGAAGPAGPMGPQGGLPTAA